MVWLIRNEIVWKKRMKSDNVQHIFQSKEMVFVLKGMRKIMRNYPFINCIAEGKRPNTINLLENQQIKQLIIKCWCQNPKQRSTINDIISQLDNVLKRMN